MRYRPRHAMTWLMLLALPFSACDCDDKIRKALSNKDPESRRGQKPVDPEGQPISSEPTEQEPNDILEEATPVELGKELRAVKGALDGSDDVDWYALSALKDEFFEITVEPQDSATDLRVALVPATQGEDPLIYDVAKAGEAEVLPIVTLGPRPLAIRVESSSGSGEYALRFKRRLSAGALEAEPNDSTTTALSLRAPTDIQGFYDRPGDTDWYAVAVESGEAAPVYALRVNPIEGLPQRVRVFVEPDEPLLTGDVGPQTPMVIPNLSFRDTDILWVAMDAPQGYDRARPYLLKLGVAPPPPQGVVLETEPNDEPGAAVSLGMQETNARGEVKVHGYLHHPADVDHFSLVLGVPPAEQPQGEDITEQLGAEVEEPPEEPVEDEATPNPDDALAEKLLGEGGEGNEAVETSERMVFEPYPPKEPPVHLLEVRVAPTSEAVKVGMAWGEGDSAKRHSAPAVGEAFALCQLPLEDGTYPFRIIAEEMSADREVMAHDYEVTLRDLSDQRGAEAMEVEPNDTRTQPDTLMFGEDEVSKGYIGSPSDRDVYHLDVPGMRDGAFQKITVSLAPHPLDLDLAMVDEQGARIGGASKGGPGEGERLSVSVPPGRYFVVVTSKTGTQCEPYVLRADES